MAPGRERAIIELERLFHGSFTGTTYRAYAASSIATTHALNGVRRCVRCNRSGNEEEEEEEEEKEEIEFGSCAREFSRESSNEGNARTASNEAAMMCAKVLREDAMDAKE